MGRKRLFNDKEKWCNKCEKWLPLDAFAENKRTASGRQDYCRTCHGSYSDVFWGKIAVVEKMLLEKHNMQPGEYLETWKHQNKKCPLCHTALVLYQRDTHVHVIGIVKVLLCAKCDVGLTSFSDNADILQRAYELLSCVSKPGTVTAPCPRTDQRASAPLP